MADLEKTERIDPKDPNIQEFFNSLYGPGVIEEYSKVLAEKEMVCEPAIGGGGGLWRELNDLEIIHIACERVTAKLPPPPPLTPEELEEQFPEMLRFVTGNDRALMVRCEELHMKGINDLAEILEKAREELNR